MTSPIKTKPRNALSPRKNTPLMIVLATLMCLGALSQSVFAQDKAVYKVRTPQPVVSCGSMTDATFVVETIPGWKWNKEYPAKVTISTPEGLEVSPGTFSKSAGNIKVDKQLVSMPFQLGLNKTMCGKKSPAGSSKVTVLASFSICNDETCRVFRNKSFEFDVQSR